MNKNCNWSAEQIEKGVWMERKLMEQERVRVWERAERAKMDAVDRDFEKLMERLRNEKSVMTGMKEKKRKSWADMVEEEEANGWVSGWPASTRAKRETKPVSWAAAVKC